MKDRPTPSGRLANATVLVVVPSVSGSVPAQPGDFREITAVTKACVRRVVVAQEEPTGESAKIAR